MDTVNGCNRTSDVIFTYLRFPLEYDEVSLVYIYVIENKTVFVSVCLSVCMSQLKGTVQ